ncbi:PspC domain-containing protein, partial [Streptomyces lonarensis]|uniref:PspC domain-containing protein n=1 Tax=Streptomyces lonarensis TaxID=700599 RepID=UPI001FD7C027
MTEETARGAGGVGTAPPAAPGGPVGGRGGVAQGLAGHLAVPVSWVRIAFFALTVSSGMGV